MNLDEALASTANVRGPQSRLERILDKMPEKHRDQILEALRSDREAAHLGRAITKLARHLRVLGDDEKDIDGDKVRHWRSSNGPR